MACSLIPRSGLALALALMATSVSAVEKNDAQHVFSVVSASVVTVKTADESGADDGAGSGVIVGPRRVITNCHVVREAAKIRIIRGTQELQGVWIKEDQRRDICLLSVEGLSSTGVAMRSSNTVAVGEPVYAVGNPLGFGLAVSRGLVAAVDATAVPMRFITTAAVSPGSSGGGLFDGMGRLVGITTGILGTGQNLALTLSSDGIPELFKQGLDPKALAVPPVAERRWEDEAIALQHGGDWVALEKHALAWSLAQPTSAKAVTFSGLALNTLKRLDEADAKFRRALALDAYYSFAWLGHIRNLVDMGHRAEAESALDKALAMAPTYPELSILRAGWRADEGRFLEARQQIIKAISDDPSRSVVWQLLGQIEDQLGNTSSSMRAFKTAVRLGNSSAAVASRLSQLLAEAGKVDEASRVDVVADAEKSIQARTQIAIGLAELKRNRLAAAEEAINKAVMLAPSLAAGWNALGTVLVKEGRHSDAEKAYSKAVLLAPNDPELLSNRALARRELGQRESALEDTRRAIGMAGAKPSVWRVYGALQADTRNFQETVRAYERVVELGESGFDDLVSLGDGYAETGDFERALKTLTRAEAINADNVRLCLAMAKTVGRMGNMERALTYEEKALKLEPTNFHAWSGKGYALLKLGRVPEAVAALETTVRLSPEMANGWINLGEAQLRNKNLGRAIDALERALALSPGALDARLFLAQAYLGAKLPAKSRDQLKNILSRQPEFGPALGMLSMAYLMENNLADAMLPYERLKRINPVLASNFRNMAISNGLRLASQLTQ